MLEDSTPSVIIVYLVFHRRQVWLADQVCNGRHYAFVCHLKKLLLI